MVAVNGPVDILPLVAVLVVHPPAAEQVVAFVDDHVRTAAAPLETAAGVAIRVTVGDNEVTVTGTVTGVD